MAIDQHEVTLCLIGHIAMRGMDRFHLPLRKQIGIYDTGATDKCDFHTGTNTLTGD